MRRRSFLQGGALAAVGAAQRGWTIGSGGNGAIRRPDDEFLATLPHLMELANLPGLGIGVVENGKMTWQHYAGVADANTKAPITRESLFPAASMGKQPFAYGVILLAQQGKIDLDQPLKEYLADGAPAGKWSEKITARHVLSHSSGLPNWRWNTDELTPAFEPGTKFRYSGEGYYYLQRCMEHITGIGAEQWMRNQVLEPLGMKSSTYLWNANAEARIVAGHQGGEPSYNTEFAKKLWLLIEASGKPLETWHHEEIVAAMLKDRPPGVKLMPNEINPNVAFSFLTTVTDYCTFLAQVVSARNSDLTAAMRAAISSPVSQINSALGWGLGFGIEHEEAEPRYLWQWGDNGGWKNFFLAHPETQTAIAAFTNGGNGMHINQRLMHAATGAEQVVFLWV